MGTAVQSYEKFFSEKVKKGVDKRGFMCYNMYVR